jgi:uncharacterized protein (TIGR02598 family)
MKKKLHSLRRPAPAFTLVEVTIALGIAAFCLISLLALLPPGMNSSKNATEETAAMNGIAGIVADLRSMPASATTSPLHGLPLTSGTFYFNDSWRKLTTASDAQYRLTTLTSVPAANAMAPVRATLQVSWPASVAPANAAGSVTVLAAFKPQ